MIPAMEPPISTTGSAYLTFNEPLDDVDTRTIQALTELYTGKEAPLMVFSRDGVTTLVIPKDLRKIFPIPGARNADSLTAEAPSVVRISNGEGANNGIGN